MAALGKLTVATCLFVHYKACCSYFLISVMNLQTKTKSFTTLVSKAFWQHLMGCLSCFLQQIYKPETFIPSYKKDFYKQNSNVQWEEFLMTKFCPWIDTRLSIDSPHRGSSRAVEKSNIFFQTDKAVESCDGDLTEITLNFSFVQITFCRG